MKILRRYFSPAPALPPAARAAMRAAMKGESQRAKLQVIVAVVRGSTPEIVAERMGLVTYIAPAHGAVVDTLVSSMVIMTFGMFGQEPTAANRDALLEELRLRLRSDIKVIHCARNGLYGTLGGMRLSFTFVIDDFVEMLGQLNSMEFGEIQEFGTPDA
jgi:hypothetical protein